MNTSNEKNITDLFHDTINYISTRIPLLYKKKYSPPAKIIEAFHNSFNGLIAHGWKYRDNKYYAVFESNNKFKEATFDKSGNLIEIGEWIEVIDAPVEISSALYSINNIVSVKKIITTENDKFIKVKYRDDRSNLQYKRFKIIKEDCQ